MKKKTLDAETHLPSTKKQHKNNRKIIQQKTHKNPSPWVWKALEKRWWKEWTKEQRSEASSAKHYTHTTLQIHRGVIIY